MHSKEVSMSDPADRSPLLQAKGLAKSYGALKVLQGVDLQVHKGESVAIVGTSGSGKTTLLSLLAGLERSNSGTLSFAGDDLTRFNERQWSQWRSQSVGIVFQEYHLIPSLTAFENVALPLEIAGQLKNPSRVDDMLQRVGLSERKHHLPHQLSGGEQQRVALARALVGRPQILFADEPTGNLDEQTADTVESLMFELIRETGLAALVVTHNPELAKRCQRIRHLHLGRFTE
jgi:putative ABC transport system ATP-binding protein